MKKYGKGFALKTVKITRRTFIKGVGAVTVTSSLGMSGALRGDTRRAKATEADESVKYIHSCCTVNCTSRCHLKGHVKNGRIVAVTPGLLPGRDDYPNACLRSMSYAQRLQDPTQRVLYPMKRVGERGEGKFKQISWDEAFELIASKLLETKEKHGAHAASFFTMSGNLAKLAWESTTRLGATFGGTTYITEGLMGDHGASMGMNLVFGQARGGHDTRDYMNSKLIILWGRNIADTHTSEMRYIIKARENGAKVIVIDPRQCSSAAVADQWIPIRPQTDPALALGMMNYMISRDLHDKAWLKANSCGPLLVREDDGQYLRVNDGYAVWDEKTKRVVPAGTADAEPALTGEYVTAEGVKCHPAFVDLAKEAAKYTIPVTAEICGLEEAMVEQLAYEYATMKPAGIRMGQGMQRVYNSFAPFRTVATLAAVAGYIGISGGGASHMGGTASINPIPGVTVPDFNFAEWSNTGGAPFIEKNSSQLYNMIENEEVKFLWIGVSNFINQSPDANRVIGEILPKVPFIVNVDPFWTWTTKYADLVLPGKTHWEVWDILVRSPWVMVDQPAIETMGESKSDCEICSEVAKRVGLGHLWNKTDEEWIRSFMTSEHPAFADFDWDTWVKEGIFARPDGIYDAVFAFEDQKYKTPTGKFEFYTERLKKYGQEVPAYTRMLEDPQGELGKKYPLVCINYHDRVNVHTQQMLYPALKIVASEPEIQINTVDAEARGIKHGDIVKVFNDRGYCMIKAFVMEGIAPGITAIPNGWTPDQYIEGNMQNLTHFTINPVEEFISQTNSAFYDVLVEVEKV
ncbi:anaerobic dehydrogenase, typically selenocysteine-containing [Desulfitobacterium dehalogenans ATCC 51507]|uniref:Anaerobic dehydrogenase, typically selenocysteine-containing n=1 Tax=Desulfitobacterium dehalogenans (strain ATCC 51507 / DSM 9161 / JW/IU-DC1) TaxID=756499 RepID=I4ADD9_DESDJ|nr:molybdopterin-dependent oxidoreductase [Desulfitobacterium dehalogenans]AFM01974.1 anaerobic dehydrogenase, typically selenocysteine-containing [Desulfitobacterium dehalogenans ATCC 51507]